MQLIKGELTMLGSLICWAAALALLVVRAGNESELYTTCFVAMGFIFLGIFSRAVSVYYETHKREPEKENKQNT